MSEEWCDLCDLPRNTCVHGMPAPPPVEKRAPARARTPRERKPAKPRTEAAPSTAVRRTARRFTPSASYRPHILAVLDAHGGSCAAEELLDEVHERMTAVLLDGDHETVAGGQIRWQYAARVERRAMATDGLLLPPTTPGVWETA